MIIHMITPNVCQLKFIEVMRFSFSQYELPRIFSITA